MKHVNTCVAVVALAAALLAAAAARADHSVFVTVPAHSEEALTWCGPAVGQMVMGGYPASACTVLQADVDASIQAHKVETNWDTDPVGLRGALAELCPPPGGHWSVVARPDAASLTHSEAFWMTRNHYPVAALLSTSAHTSFAPHQEHWVTIKGMVTDLDPTTNPTVTLKYVFFTDPAVPLGDPPLDRFVTGAVWFGGLQAVTKAPSAYTGKFVAVIEPPAQVGKVRVGRLLLVGRVIARSAAQRAAAQAVRELKLAEVPSLRGLANAQPLEPLLVDAKRGGYYIVPFGVAGRPSSVAVLVNAYDGSFLEAGRMAPRAFMAEREALERLNKAFKFEKALGPGEYEASLVTTPDARTRYLPEWRFAARGRTLSVGQLGEVREIRAANRTP